MITHCIPAHIRQVGAGSTLTGRHPLVHSRCTFQLRLPDPDRLAVPTRPGVVGAAFHPFPAFPRTDCPLLRSGRCDDPRVEVSHLHSVVKRRVAHVLQIEPTQEHLP